MQRARIDKTEPALTRSNSTQESIATSKLEHGRNQRAEMSFERVSLDKFAETFSTTIGTCVTRVFPESPADNTARAELSSVALGGQVCSVSDEFFAEAYQLLLVEVCRLSHHSHCSSLTVTRRLQPAPSLKGQFGPKGALFSGWETRRHNPAYDWYVRHIGAMHHNV